MARPARRFPEAILGTTLLTVLVAVPLLIAPGVSFHFDVTPKVVVLLLGAAGGLLLWDGFLPGLRSMWNDPRVPSTSIYLSRKTPYCCAY